MFTTANILQITDVVRRLVFSLFLLCVYPVVGLFTLRETCDFFRRFVLLYQNNVTSSQGFSVAVHFSAINAVLLTRPFHISETSFTFGDCYLVMKNCPCDLSQSEMETFFEWIILSVIDILNYTLPDKAYLLSVVTSLLAFSYFANKDNEKVLETLNDTAEDQDCAFNDLYLKG